MQELDNAYIYIPRSSSRRVRGMDELPWIKDRIVPGRIITSLEGLFHFRTLVCDMRQSSGDIFTGFQNTSVTLGIDEGGKFRQVFDYLLDPLPMLPKYSMPNFSSRSLLFLPEKRRPPRTADPGAPGAEGIKTLIVFGGEDPAGLSAKTAALLADKDLVPPPSITVVQGPLMQQKEKERPLPGGIQIWGPKDNLKEELAAFDLVITGFGLTAFEAAAAGCGVICVHPSRYHRRLADNAGFCSAGTGRPSPRLFRDLFLDFPRVFLRSREIIDTAAHMPAGNAKGAAAKSALAALLESLETSGPEQCPACGGGKGTGVFRDRDRTIHLCGKCGLLFQTRFVSGKVSYGKDYFFSEYKAQYGRTYLEDFSHIKSVGRERVKVLEKLEKRQRPVGMERGKPALLDIGCAYGAFLAAAAESEFQCFGCDISELAVSYVKEELAFPAAVFDFEARKAADLKMELKQEFDAVTMWFVLEHFTNTGRILKKIRACLKPEGIFAFSTPNASGLLGRFQRERFFAHTPADHFTIWSPKSARKVLKKFGFKIEKIRITGYHPERIPRITRTSGPFFAAVRVFCRVFRLGDTFEVYARLTAESKDTFDERI